MANLNAISNADLWNAIRAKYPQFRSHTSEATLDMFTERGFEQLKTYDTTALNDFFNLSMRVYLQLINVSHAKDTLEDKGFGEHYDMPWGAYIQRMAIGSIKPISAAYKNLPDGGTVDPFVIRKPLANERIFKQNFDYASLITIPDEFAMKQIFVAQNGMSEFMAGIFAGLENGYTTQVFVNKLEALNAGINSTNFPLKDTQKVDVPLSATATDAQLTDFILSVKNIVSAFDLAPQTDAYNAAGFASTQDIGRLKLLIRPGYKNAIATRVLTNAYNQEHLTLPVDVIEVPHFGGLQAYKEAAFTTPLYPVYNKLGEQVGFAETDGATAATVDNDAVFWKDPNENVIAVLADKGYLFTTRQNPYSVEPIRNPRGLYTNYWASSPNNAINVDPVYNIVTFNKTNPTGG